MERDETTPGTTREPVGRERRWILCERLYAPKEASLLEPFGDSKVHGNDTSKALSAAGAPLGTGPTGTNVNDLRVTLVSRELGSQHQEGRSR